MTTKFGLFKITTLPMANINGFQSLQFIKSAEDKDELILYINDDGGQFVIFEIYSK